MSTRWLALVVGLGLSACAQGYSWVADLPPAASGDAGAVGGGRDAGAGQTDGGGSSPAGMQPAGGGLFADCAKPSACLPNPSCSGEQSGNAYYFFCGAASTWDEAQASCKTTPGTELAYIESDAENTFVSGKVGRDMWLGGKRAAGTWSWSGGSEFWTGDAKTGKAPDGTFTTWVADHPNDAGDCLLFFSARKAWAAAGCALKFGFVCKREQDLCPDDASKMEPGECGCGMPDSDSDGDGTADCKDMCPMDPNQGKPGTCGCIGAPDPAPAGTACADGMCAANTMCDGRGSCGSPDECCTKATCLATECGSKPDGCGGAVLCDFMCPAGVTCGANNTCGCVATACPATCTGLGSAPCCKPDMGCGCSGLLGLGCN